MLTYIADDALTDTTPSAPSEIMLTVAGYPPTKNEAKSLLSEGHPQFPRVRALLEAASQALDAGAQPFTTGRLGLELVVSAPTDAPSDATNYLGGVTDVLEDKEHRGELAYLDSLARVAVLANDRQIRHVLYREERAAEPRYLVRLWVLDEPR
jgi:hypothetical protein